MRWCFSFAFVLMVAASVPAKATTVGEWIDVHAAREPAPIAAAWRYTEGAWRGIMLIDFGATPAGRRMAACVRRPENSRNVLAPDFAPLALGVWIRNRLSSADEEGRATLRGMDVAAAVWPAAELALVC